MFSDTKFTARIIQSFAGYFRIFARDRGTCFPASDQLFARWAGLYMYSFRTRNVLLVAMALVPNLPLPFQIDSFVILLGNALPTSYNTVHQTFQK
jgi:hypothetical protein